MRKAIALAFIQFVLGAISSIPARVHAYEIDLAMSPGVFSDARELDGLSATQTYIVDYLVTRVPITAMSLTAGDYGIRALFDADEFIEFAPNIERFAFALSFGAMESWRGMHHSGDGSHSSINVAIDNLSLTSMGSSAVSFYPAGGSTIQAIGAGIDNAAWPSDHTITVPGQPFRLRSLEMDFHIPTTWPPSYLPQAQVDSIRLVIGAGDIVETSQLPTLPPILRFVPEPSGAGIVLLMTMLFWSGRRRTCCPE